MTTFRNIVVVAVASIFFLVGCGQQAGESPSDPGAQQHAATHEEPSVSDGPPESTLSYGGRTVTGLLGTYCRGSPSGGICADAVGAQVADEEDALTIPAGSIMVFDLGGSVRLSSVGAVAYPIGRGNEVRSDHGLRFLEPKEGRRVLASEDLKVRREEDRTEIRAELSAGEYIVDVFVTVPAGDASYSFRVAAGGEKGAS